MDEPPITESKQRTSVCTLITEFCGYTSAVGPGRIHDGKCKIQKFVWVLLFVGAIVAFGIQISDLYKKFQQRPLATNVKIIHDASLHFPSITICNFNPIRQSQLGRSPTIRRHLEEEYDSRNLTDNPGRQRVASRYGHDSNSSDSSSRKIREVKENTAAADTEYYDEDFDEEGIENPNELDSEFANELKMSILLANENETLLRSMGHAFEDLVSRCTFRGIHCRDYTRLWTTFWHYQYGNCYTFNPWKKDGKVLKSNKAGPKHGLVLELNIQQDEYIGALTEEAGVKLDISYQGEMPFPLEKGFNVVPGFETSIGLRKVTISREDPFENGRCAKGKIDSGNIYRMRYGAAYSATACKESCLAYNQLSRCKCMEYRFPVVDEKILVCDTLNTTTAKCLGRVQKMFKNNQLNCSTSCRSPCNETYCKVVTSYAVWPSKTHEKYLMQTDQLYASGDESYRSSILKIRVFFEELNFEAIEEVRSYELVNFVSDFGGQLGLWIGFSVLTAAEFFELVLLILHHLIKKCTDSKKEKLTKEKDSKLNEINMRCCLQNHTPTTVYQPSYRLQEEIVPSKMHFCP